MRWVIYLILLTIIGVAIRQCQPGIEKTLLKTNIMAQGMATPEEFAKFVQRGDLKAVQYYLKAGMSPDAVYIRDPVLIVALYEKQFDVAKALLDAGAKPNVQDRDGRTPLILAASLREFPQKSLELTKTLLAKGADKSMVDSKGMTAIDYAWNSSNAEVARFLESDSNIDNFYGYDNEIRAQELLEKIAKSQSEDAFKELVRFGNVGIGVVIEGLNSDDARVKNMSVNLLPRMGKIPAEHREVIQILFDDPKTPNRGLLAKGLVQTAQTPKEKVTLLASLLKEKDYQILYYALEQLGGLGKTAEPAIPALNELMHRDTSMRRSVQFTLNKIRP